MKWARIVRAWHAAEQAARESAASRKRIELAEAERRALTKRYRPRVDDAVETFICLVLGILIGAILLRAC